ncbi:glycosyltransferase [Candidatus Kaiserbacteria bacterium]|nr:glycosyltransferase [Candidatus Kaiserbacteria bacterium]
MKVCYFGIYDPLYARNRILIDGLRQNCIEIIKCDSRRRGILKYIDLAIKHWRIRKEYDAMIIGFPGYQAMIVARFLTRKPIIFDCFTSLHDSMVSDRSKVSPRSIKAIYFWFLDWLSMQIADVILFDTQAHIDYASATFGIKKRKFKRIWIGANTDIFSTHYFVGNEESVVENSAQGLALRRSESTGKGLTLRQEFSTAAHSEESKDFSVLFFGTFIPLQGIEYIIEAAKRLENEAIHFAVIGNGQMKKKILWLAGALAVRNVLFIDFLSQEALVKKIAEADVCLGIFGNTLKTQRVIPNKVYECLAMKKPVITADTPAARELLSDRDVCFVKTADSASLAEGILRIKNDKNTMENIAQNGYDTFIKNATPNILGRELKGIVEELSYNMKHRT